MRSQYLEDINSYKLILYRLIMASDNIEERVEEASKFLFKEPLSLEETGELLGYVLN